MKLDPELREQIYKAMDEALDRQRMVADGIISTFRDRLKVVETRMPSAFTLADTETLIARLKAAGVKSFKQGDLELTFESGVNGRVRLPPRRPDLPTNGVLAEPADMFQPSPEELGEVT